ncbi:MAG: CCA tRNA nucleotidyltransferase [Phycisphaerales bacterium]|nr:CCA tRNA nucleotidyltransferase [Phycisphaerales bacterium]
MAAVMQKWTSGEARAAGVAIVRTLRDAGHAAYFAGGCVRDELLGFEPFDFDVATDAAPDRIQELFRRTAAVGASFGVVLVRERGVTVEVATFRADGPYSDRRRPDHVEFSDAAHDAQRRDFTINALFLDPLAPSGSRGRVIDHVGGMADIDARLLRAVGEADLRLAEDHLRALRAVRFAARYGLTIEPGTADAIRRHAGRLAGVSRERIGDELRRMMAHQTRAIAATLLADLGLDAVVFGSAGPPAPSLSRLAGTPSFACCLACWALERGAIRSAAQIPGLVGGWRRSLCLSNDERAGMRDIMASTLEVEQAWEALAPAPRKRLAAREWFEETLAVVGARDAARAEGVRQAVRALASDGIGLAPAPLISGDDLAGAGLQPGPAFARVLAAVYDAQLEGRVATRAAALALALRLARELGSPESV